MLAFCPVRPSRRGFRLDSPLILLHTSRLLLADPGYFCPRVIFFQLSASFPSRMFQICPVPATLSWTPIPRFGSDPSSRTRSLARLRGKHIDPGPDFGWCSSLQMIMRAIEVVPLPNLL